eukprot:TRINITY_DN7901_c0_g1_i1.p1 TRINITY_DN7901_c0_g1~~TRINITY_DN7901_c0_g1_i1.p1  ORF type:complete len:305 (-),score=50.89 TRINITY_DN7901_c0_g1_i1:51-965(-)
MGVKINIPLIMLVAAQVAVLVFGIIELKNPSRNWAFYNRQIGRGNIVSTHYKTGGCTFKPHTSSPAPLTPDGHLPLNAPQSENEIPPKPQPIPVSTASDSSEPSSEESYSEESDGQILNNDVKQLNIAYTRNSKRSFYPRHQWVELGWKNWCSPIICGKLIYGAGAIAKDAALYGAITSVVGSVIIILASFFVSFNDNKRLMSSAMLVSMVIIFLLFLLAATAASWIVWVVNVHKYVHHMDSSYEVTYGYCFVLAILASCMEFFSILLVLLSRWKFGMELPIGEDPEEEAYYSKLHSQRVATLL